MTPPTDQPLNLDEILARAAHLYEYVQQTDEADVLAGTDVPAMADEIRRLRQQRAYLLDQLAKKDARTGAATTALREFLVADDQPAARP